MSLRAAPYSSTAAVVLSFVLYLVAVKTSLHSGSEEIPPIYLLIDEKEDIKLQIIEAYH